MRTILRDDCPTKTLNLPLGTTQACLTTSLQENQHQHDLRRVYVTRNRPHQIDIAFRFSLTTTVAVVPFLRNVRSNPATLFSFFLPPASERTHLEGPWEVLPPPLGIQGTPATPRSRPLRHYFAP